MNATDESVSMPYAPIDSTNHQRQFRVAAGLIAPSALYVFCLGTAIAYYILTSGGLSAPANAANLVGRSGLGVSFLSGLATFILLTFWRLLDARTPLKLTTNWSDYWLAGFDGKRMLWGLAGPRLIGSSLLGAIECVISAAAIVAYFLTEDPRRIQTSDDWKGFGVGCAALSFLVVTSAYMEVSIWPLSHSRMRRAAAILLLVMTSPFLWSLFLVSNFAARYDLYNILWFGEIVSWPIRSWIVVHSWRRGIQRLGQEPELGVAS